MGREFQAKEEASPPHRHYQNIGPCSILYVLFTAVYHAYADENSAAENGKKRNNPSGTHQEEDPNGVVILNDNFYRERNFAGFKSCFSKSKAFFYTRHLKKKTICEISDSVILKMTIAFSANSCALQVFEYLFPMTFCLD